MSKNVRSTISSESAPQAIGPYSQAVKVGPLGLGSLIFVSGSLGINTTTGKLGANIKEQTDLSLKHMLEIVKTGGGNASSVIKCTVYLKDMSYFGEMNEIYAKYFPRDPPARACVAVAGLPKDALVEIECLASDVNQTTVDIYT